jgi:hypothetical protein
MEEKEFLRPQLGINPFRVVGAVGLERISDHLGSEHSNEASVFDEVTEKILADLFLRFNNGLVIVRDYGEYGSDIVHHININSNPTISDKELQDELLVMLKQPKPQILQLGTLQQKFNTILPSNMNVHSVSSDRVVHIFSPEFIKSIEFEEHGNGKIGFYATVENKREEILPVFFSYLKELISPRTKDSVFVISDKSLIEQTLVSWVLFLRKAKGEQ